MPDITMNSMKNGTYNLLTLELICIVKTLCIPVIWLVYSFYASHNRLINIQTIFTIITNFVTKSKISFFFLKKIR